MTIRQDVHTLDEQGLLEVLALVEKIVKAASSGGFIFRGENEKFEHVSSGLYRQYFPNKPDSSDVEIFQTKILEEARKFTSEIDENHLLSQLQHFESRLTNLVDFTTDYLIALFFACEGSFASDGRVVFLQKENANLFEPDGPSNRVIAQKSVFVRPATGIVEPDAQVDIPASLKPSVLQYLQTFHSITPQSIYNDLHGFIRHWSIHRHASEAFFAGIVYASNGCHLEAVDRFNEALYFQPSYQFNFERGMSFLAIGDWDSAIDDFDAVKFRALDDADLFMCVAAFNGRGIALRKQGEHVDAANDFRAAVNYLSMRIPPDVALEEVDFSPDEQDAFSYLVVTLMEIGDFESALDSAVVARQRGYDPSSLFRHHYDGVDSFESIYGTRVPQSLVRALFGLSSDEN